MLIVIVTLIACLADQRHSTQACHVLALLLGRNGGGC